MAKKKPGKKITKRSTRKKTPGKPTAATAPKRSKRRSEKGAAANGKKATKGKGTSKSKAPQSTDDPKPASKGQVLSGQRTLAEAVGRSKTCIHEWVHDDRWPFGKRGPWNVADVLAWVGANLTKEPSDVGIEKSSSSAAAEPSILTKRRTEKIELEIKAQRLALARELGLVISREDARDEINAHIITLRNNLQAIPHRETATLDAKGLLADGAREKVERHLSDAIEGFLHDYSEGLLNCVDD